MQPLATLLHRQGFPGSAFGIQVPGADPDERLHAAGRREVRDRGGPDTCQQTCPRPFGPQTPASAAASSAGSAVLTGDPLPLNSPPVGDFFRL